jgi:hypothetical protein
VARVEQDEARERQRHDSIVLGRASPASGALAIGDRAIAELLPLLRARLEKRPLSPSLLEMMAGCGFRTLCERILDLKPPDERSEELAPNESGTVRHRCLHAGFEALRQAGLLPLQGGDRRGLELQTLLGAARAALDAYEREEPVGHPTVWAAERHTIERQLGRLYGRELADPGWEPSYFELEFQQPPAEPTGPAPRPPLRLDLPSGAALLGGKIDRVDRAGAKLRVIDYKSGSIGGRARHLEDDLGKSELQLAIYALLVRQALAPGAPVDAAYLSIVEAKLSKTMGDIGEKQGIDLDLFLATDETSRARCRAEGRLNLVDRIGELLAETRAGHFPVTPGNCGYCDHVSACRVGPYYEERSY